IWGTGEVEYRNVHILDEDWASIASPKHKMILHGVQWDYVNETACGDKGNCKLAGPVALDIATLFASKYAPPEGWDSLGTIIGENLLRPDFDPTVQQQFFLGGHLMGLAMLENGEPGCKITQ